MSIDFYNNFIYIFDYIIAYYIDILSNSIQIYLISIYIFIDYYIFLYDSQGFLSILRKGEIVPLANIQKRDIYIQDVHIVQIGQYVPDV